MTEDQQPRDHIPADDGIARAESSDLENNIKRRSTWLRLGFILVFLVLYAISRFVVFVTVVLQFLWVLVTAAANGKLTYLGQSLARYTYQIIRYVTFNSDKKPFPFDLEWPSGEADPSD